MFLRIIFSGTLYWSVNVTIDKQNRNIIDFFLFIEYMDTVHEKGSECHLKSGKESVSTRLSIVNFVFNEFWGVGLSQCGNPICIRSRIY